MATAEMRVQAARTLEFVEKRKSAEGGRAAFRLLSAERSDEILPILVEEIVALGCPRALVNWVDLETGDVRPAAQRNCSPTFLRRFTTALFQGNNPIVRILNSRQPGILPKAAGEPSFYCHPILFRNRKPCWEAERPSRAECLAVRNFHQPGKLDLQEQECPNCGMRAYAAAVIAELPRRKNEKLVSQVGELIELANGYLSRLFKVDHYYNKMRDSDVTIAQMQTLMQSMADPVILTDAQHRVIAQNRAAERFFRLPGEITEGAARAVELNNLLFSAALSSIAVSGAADTSRDLTLVDVIEGEEVLFEAVSAPSFSHDGSRAGLVTVMRDVTDLRRADEQFRSSMRALQNAEETVRQDRDRLNLVIENVGDPIVVADKFAKIVLLDPLAQKLFGKLPPVEQSPEAETLINTSGEISLVQPVTAEELPQDIIKNQVALDVYLRDFTFSFDQNLSESLRLFDPATQSEVEYDTRSGKIYDQRGQVSYTITVLRDFSALRKLEQMRLERRMLEMEKFAATGRLAGTIAHEVNNPMEAIKNSIYLLQGQVAPKAEPVYGVLRAETERVARIVRQMLGLYRHSEKVGPVNVNTVVEDTLALFTRQLERAGVEVRVQLGQLPTMIASADQVRQVLSNLVVNAKDTMVAAGEAEGASARHMILTLRTRHLRSEEGIHDRIRMTVADTGAGISPEMMKTMFEPFVSTKGEKGTGLGLWIVKGIIENHGGLMRVRSREGRGTVFKIEWPVLR